MNWLAMLSAKGFAGLVAVVCVALLTTSCSLFHPDPVPAESPPSRSVPQLAQVGFGRQAEFRQCAAASCPKRTPKTLPLPAGAAAPESRQPDSLDAGAPATTIPVEPP